MACNSYGNRFGSGTPVVINLIIANVVIYLGQVLFKSLNLTELGSLHYFTSPDFKPHQIVTSFFLHSPGTIFHLIFNMFCLYTFGTMLEKVWGPKKFFGFYMICGVGASLILMLSIPFTASQFAKSVEAAAFGGNIPEVVEAYKNQYSALGASGAVMGVEAAFAFLFPNTELMVMFIPVPVKAKYVIPGFILLDLFGGFAGGSNIAHFAHLGGALIGFLLVLYWNKTNKNTFY
jgi:membrane associated rhomboid family serine protease